MVARGPGAVGCAHCTRLGAEQACAACRHLVCAACAADWTTCELATVKTFELARRTAVIDVDWGGRYMLAQRGKLLGVFDLHAETWLTQTLPFEADIPVAMLRSGEVLGGMAYVDPQYTHGTRRGFTQRDAAGKATRSFNRSPFAEAPSDLSRDGSVFAYRSHLVHVVVMELGTPVATWRRFEPLKGKVIEGVAVHDDFLAAASWGELALLRMEGSSLALRTHHVLDGEVRWCALAGSTLAVADATHVRAWRVREDGNAHEALLGVERKRIDGHGPARAFALSFDGRFLAAGNVVHDLAHHRSRSVAAGPADAVVFAKFVADDRWLVTCDDDRRLVMRSEYGR